MLKKWTRALLPLTVIMGLALAQPAADTGEPGSAPASAPVVEKVQVMEIKPVTIAPFEEPKSTGTTTYKLDVNLSPSKAGVPNISSSDKLTVSGVRAEAAVKHGAPKCGGVIDGVAQEPCGFAPAKKARKFTLKCDKGSFLDIGLMQCWSCPEGYHRSEDAVTSSRACVKRTTRPAAHAKVSGGTSLCPKGSFFDRSRGGECRSCPDGYKRSILHVDTVRACTKGLLGPHAPAAHVKKAECEPGEFRAAKKCWSCPKTFKRTAHALDGPKACHREANRDFKDATMVKQVACPKGESFDPIDGGSCWACPDQYKRSARRVDGPKACVARGMVWESPAYPEPGLFGLKGAEQLALELVAKPEIINALADGVSAEAKSDAAAYRRQVWEELRTAPERSAALKSAVYARLVEFAEDGSGASEADRELIAAFADYMRARKTYVADEALSAYDHWVVADAYARGQRPLNMMSLFDYGTPPPDFTQILTSMLFTATSTIFWAGTYGTLLGVAPIRKFIFPFRGRGGGGGGGAGNAVGNAGKASAKLLGKLGAKVAGKLVLGASKALMGFLSFGPQIIVTIATIVAQLAIEQVIEIANARPRLLNAKAAAEQPVDLGRLVVADRGSEQALMYWGLATSGERKPSAATAAKLAALAAKQVR